MYTFDIRDHGDISELCMFRELDGQIRILAYGNLVKLAGMYESLKLICTDDDDLFQGMTEIMPRYIE